MGMRQPARLSPTPAYGLPEGTLATERTGIPSGLIPLMLLVLALAAATVWYVALPALEKPVAKRSCEVVVLQSGSPECVTNPARGSGAATPKHAHRVKR
jgi:hypothetical protein